MANIRLAGTQPELALRRELFRAGLRYRVNFKVSAKPRRVADIVFPKLRIAIFVDGCFCHGCPAHATWPKQNAAFWREKIEANRVRDSDTTSRLRAMGWTVLRYWSHESPAEVAAAVLGVVQGARRAQRGTNHPNLTNADSE